jgi:hypothetical protein
MGFLSGIEDEVVIIEQRQRIGSEFVFGLASPPRWGRRTCAVPDGISSQELLPSAHYQRCVGDA